jgi:hypothetical protein
MSLDFGLPADSRAVVGRLKLILLSERLSHMSGLLSCHLSWLIAQVGESEAGNHA